MTAFGIDKARSGENLMKRLFLIGVVGCLAAFSTGCSGASDEARVENTYQKFRSAIKSGDVSALKKNVSSRYAAEFLAPGQEQKLAMLKAVVPDTIEIKHKDIREKEAIISTQGMKEGMAVEGTTTLILEGGAWKVYNESWEIKATVAEPSPDEQSSIVSDGSYVPSAHQAGEAENQKSVNQLMADLRNPNYYGKEPILDSLLKRGAREEAVRVLNEMLRSKPDFPSDVKGLLKQAGAPVTFDWQKSSFEPDENRFLWREVEFEFKDGRIYSSGHVYLGRDVVEGFSRPQRNEPPFPMFARYRLRVKGGTLIEPIEKVVEVEHRPGDHTWNNLEIASGLGKGEYKVDLYLHAQTVMPDGAPMSLNAGPVILTLEGE
ncbi:MAG: hypothetical protein KCHDKBKB_02519 [Elusimicrobia bacterium]|nr:hypothetical protein [Elusimicrobiota bacterium]